MSADNEANQANFDEVQSHLNAIAAKLKTANDEQRVKLLEDQTDYYESAINYRRMASETYMLQRDEARETAEHIDKLYKRAYWHRLFLIAITVAALLIAGGELWRPGVCVRLVKHAPMLTIASYLFAVAVGAGSVKLLSARNKLKFQ